MQNRKLGNLWPVSALTLGGGGQGSIETEGTGIGMIRHLDIPGTGKMAERLDQLDAATMTIGYILVYGNPAGMSEYRAVVRLSDAAGGCRVDWHGEFVPAEGQDTDTVAGNLEAAYHGMSDALEAYVAQGQ
jgi:hypothetical protein